MLDCSQISNCDQCSQNKDFSNTELICRKCQKGTFMYNNECLEKCPIGFRADRITWSCLQPPVFGWYWVYPSVNSCRNQCGILNNEKDSDCSCFNDCVQAGTCCPDFDFYCGDVIYFRKDKH